ncbi:MAG: IS66 family transposase [Clostridium neonatale]
MEDINFDELDDKTKLIVSKMEKVINNKNSEIHSKNKEIEELKNQLAFLKGQIISKNRKMFGKSSEQVDESQLSFFNEAEKDSDSKIPEPEIQSISYNRKKPASHNGKKDNTSNLKRVIIEHKLDDAQKTCIKCGHQMSFIGTQTKELLKFKPAEIYIEEHRTEVWACKNCESEADKANIIYANGPKTLLHKSMSSNELDAHVITMKYLHSMPLNRMETYFQMMDVSLSRQTLSNWIINSAFELECVYNCMKKNLLESNYIYADETPVKVIDSKGKESKSKHYMWVYVSDKEDISVILYDYQKTRSSSCPVNFLKGFSGYLQTDGYSGYNKVEHVKRPYCLAHIQRKFFDIITELHGEAIKQSRAIIGFNYCEKLYPIEKDLREQYSGSDNYYDDRHRIRLEKSLPVFNEFQKYIDDEIPDELPASAIGKALSYTQKLLPSMKAFFTSGSLEIDNNAAERAVKLFVIGRKNCCFQMLKKVQDQAQ